MNPNTTNHHKTQPVANDVNLPLESELVKSLVDEKNLCETREK